MVQESPLEVVRQNVRLLKLEIVKIRTVDARQEVSGLFGTKETGQFGYFDLPRVKSASSDSQST